MIDAASPYSSLEGLSALQPAVKKNDELGQEAFMRLMVAQLENQDPTKPMDNFQFLSQIAQFGTVSGIQELQSSLSGLVDSLQSGQVLQASSLVGRNLVSPYGDGILTAGGSLSAQVELPVYTSGLTVQIQDASGTLVKTLSLGPTAAGKVHVDWDGTTGNGDRAAPGVYQFRAQAYINGSPEAVPAFAVQQVQSVTVESDGSLALNLSGGRSVSLKQVRDYL